MFFLVVVDGDSLRVIGFAWLEQAEFSWTLRRCCDLTLSCWGGWVGCDFCWF